MPIAFWVHNLSPFLGPHWGNFGIRYYGLTYVIGFVVIIINNTRICT